MRKTIQLNDVSEWELAMKEKCEYLIANGTWELTPLSKGHKVVKCKWVFCTNKDANGVVVHFKARWLRGACKWHVWILAKYLNPWPNLAPLKM